MSATKFFLGLAFAGALAGGLIIAFRSRNEILDVGTAAFKSRLGA